MGVTGTNSGEVFQFPLSYPLKVVGKNTNEFYATVNSIIEKHLEANEEVTCRTRTSSGGEYLSVTATFNARSKTQLDAIYQELNNHELVIMTL
ncbi:MAG: DUF493 domain-containing protein [Syntrophobacterales bacterium]|jgi:putative lipoic acid-binding regulatory protein|nr:DUF493 domain-containing protein [Syntrophobacterales bacterium]